MWNSRSFSVRIISNIQYMIMKTSLFEMQLYKYLWECIVICDVVCSVLKRYCYLDFGDPLSAQGGLNALNNKPIPGTNVRMVLCLSHFCTEWPCVCWLWWYTLIKCTVYLHLGAHVPFDNVWFVSWSLIFCSCFWQNFLQNNSFICYSEQNHTI